ncbi:protein of unknown function [Pseudomonas sp. JV241A]|nr:protein of unknown function [Pseudomonas sp. JV241A]
MPTPGSGSSSSRGSSHDVHTHRRPALHGLDDLEGAEAMTEVSLHHGDCLEVMRSIPSRIKSHPFCEQRLRPAASEPPYTLSNCFFGQCLCA